MIALDTNLLVRFLVADDEDQTARARYLLQRAVDEDSPCYVSEVVLCELVWVLQKRFGVPREEMIEVLKQLMRARGLLFASRDQLAGALHAYARGAGDFADYFIREQARAAGCEAVATFDRALLGEPGFISP